MAGHLADDKEKESEENGFDSLHEDGGMIGLPGTQSKAINQYQGADLKTIVEEKRLLTGRCLGEKEREGVKIRCNLPAQAKG
jgi:hypothetical protein